VVIRRRLSTGDNALLCLPLCFVFIFFWAIPLFVSFRCVRSENASSSNPVYIRHRIVFNARVANPRKILYVVLTDSIMSNNNAAQAVGPASSDDEGSATRLVVSRMCSLFIFIFSRVLAFANNSVHMLVRCACPVR